MRNSKPLTNKQAVWLAVIAILIGLFGVAGFISAGFGTQFVSANVSGLCVIVAVVIFARTAVNLKS